jgi:hypothetical protein
MANVVKYKKTGDMEMQGAILLNPLTASNVPNAGSGQKTLFLDVADTTLKTKDSSGTVAAIGGSGGGLTVEEVTTDTTIANGKLYISNSSNNINFTLPATYVQGFTFAILKKGTGNIVIKSGATGQYITIPGGDLPTSTGANQAIAENLTLRDYMEFIAETANTQIRAVIPGSIKAPTVIVQINSSTTWTVPVGITNLVKVYLIGGGGAGGAYAGSGGGGAGGVQELSNVSVTPGNGMSLIIGAGGAAVHYDQYPSDGGSTSGFGSTAIGGGGGAVYYSGGWRAGNNGGSGGGGGTTAGTGSQGHNGGVKGSTGGGGGGGYSAAGGVGGGIGGNGGYGLDLSAIIGTGYGVNGKFAGGGGGSYGGTGYDGGGNGSYDGVGGSGVANTGGGGGATYAPSTGTMSGPGGSGTIIIIY